MRRLRRLRLLWLLRFLRLLRLAAFRGQGVRGLPLYVGEAEGTHCSGLADGRGQLRKQALPIVLGAGGGGRSSGSSSAVPIRHRRLDRIRSRSLLNRLVLPVSRKHLFEHLLLSNLVVRHVLLQSLEGTQQLSILRLDFIRSHQGVLRLLETIPGQVRQAGPVVGLDRSRVDLQREAALRQHLIPLLLLALASGQVQKTRHFDGVVCLLLRLALGEGVIELKQSFPILDSGQTVVVLSVIRIPLFPKSVCSL
mmetsp:Transcript_167975/g.534240  ORF Transcript_167975/g.534240 Transcript_167975/m.534240 type:complete len:252 (+) Transcript_167975:709-1464(+)